ncbi:MAG: hypothetical protein H6670_08535 [Anaerolineaceae bacterium]|nr:hypothetical protein [Anaerolineaceae bacterium]
MTSTNNRRADVGVFDSLTERENEILACLVQGMSNREVSDRLNLAVTTVKWYTRQIYNKLGVNSRREAVALAKDYGLFHLSVTQSTKTRHNLPAETTLFIGRKREIDTVTNLLEQPKHRLLTILAPGGMGKSRLALQIGRIHPDRFADGIYFVALQSLSASEQIVVTIGESIGFVFVPGERSPEQQLLDFLKNKEMLLILDNFEHLLAGTTYVTDILRTAPQIKILTTSRQSLNLTSETVLKLNGLAYERDGDSSDAADLFVDAVRQLSPAFQSVDQFQETIDRICQLTEGMPLALLLAAAWSDTLTLAQIADEIEAGIGFLEQTKSDLPLRHRGIRAVFEPTWQRLTESERLVLARFSVFAGGCTYEAATQVAKATPAILQSLVNKALIIHSINGRYEMHELLRQYAEEKLQQLYNDEETKQVHAEYYSKFLAKYGIELRNPSTQKFFPHEIGNLRGMWYHFVDTHQWTYVEHLAIGMRWLYEFYGLYHEASHWFESATDSIVRSGEDEQNPSLYGVILAVLTASRKDIDHPDMEKTARHALDILDSCKLNVASSHAMCIAHTQVINLVSADISDYIWQSRFERVFPIFHKADEQQGMCVSYILLTIEDLLVHHNLDIAQENGERALEYAHEADDVGATAWANGTLASIAFQKCKYDLAIELLKKQCESFSAINKKTFLNHVKSSIGFWSALIGSFDQAYMYFELALHHDRQFEWVYDEVRHLLELCTAYLLDDRPQDCKKTLDYIKSLLEQIKHHSAYNSLFIEHQYVHSMNLLRNAQYDAVMQVCESAQIQCENIQKPWAKDYIPHFHHLVGQALTKLDRPTEARKHLLIALRASSMMHKLRIHEIMLSCVELLEPAKQIRALSYVAMHPATAYTHRQNALLQLNQLSSLKEYYSSAASHNLNVDQEFERYIFTYIDQNPLPLVG